MKELVKLTTQQVGRCGELLVQYKLLKAGIESAPMTTDAGIDLLAFNATSGKTASIQVKTATHRERESGNAWVVWPLAKQSPAQYVAAVDLERDKAWLFKLNEFRGFAGSGRWLWWYVSGQRPKRAKSRPEEDFANYELDVAASRLFNE